MTKIIIIGGVAGGATFASQLRRLDPDCDITIFEKDRDITFANCGLPYYLGNLIDNRSELLNFTPEQFKENKGITAKVFHEVIQVDPNNQTVTVKNLKSDETFTESYDYLVMSPGCRANRLPLESNMAFTLRNLEDTDDIESYITKNNVKKALIIGAGYISLEVLENFYNRDIQTTLIHRSEKINKLMDQDMNKVIFDEMDERQIDYRLNEEVDSVDGQTVHFKSGNTEDFDIIIEGIGIKPNTEFLEGSGIEEDDAGYIPINEYFQTNYRNIYAIGDIASNFYRHVNLPTHVPLAWGAHRGASIAAEHITQTRNVPFKGFLASNAVKFFDYTLTSVGVSPSDLSHFDYTIVEAKQMNHAGYYPGAEPLHLRVYFENKSRKILRAAAVGKSGADKRIDILSMAMQNDMTVDELTEFESAYAPPFSSPKDIINMIGYKAQNK